jgi:Rad3-related DNA helicase
MFEVVWGQDHYPCVHPDVISSFKAMYGDDPSRADCPYSPVSECDHVGRCEYERAKKTCMYAQAKVLNYHYAYYARWWREWTEDLFCDEAHRLPIILSDLVSIEIRDGLRKKYNLPPFPLARGGAPFMLKTASEWAGAASRSLAPFTRSRDLQIKKRAERLKAAFLSLCTSLEESDEAEWYVESKPGEKFLCKPVVPDAFARSILVPQARSITLMSATIGDPAVLASELGIDDYTFVTYPHIFPKENRPVFFYKSSPRISYRSGDKDYAKQIQIVMGILKDHRGQKGIIHTSSWSHAKRLARALTRDFDVYLPDPRERIKSIERFKTSPPGTVAISPSWNEGLDLTDDLARFAIVVKVPWPSLADPIVSLRLKRKGGKAWFDWIAALAIVQGAGRIVRHPEDYGVTYIVDGHWPRVARRAPEWFEWETV